MLPGDTLHSIFEARACAAPARVAVVCAGEQITYGALNQRAEQLASRLRSMGIGPDVLVGLCVGRNLQMIVGMLAILKAGGAYVPMDPAYPAKRIEFLCEDSAVPVVVAEKATVGCLGKCKAKIICIDQEQSCSTDAPGRASQRHNLSYVIYTSGSTGTPKGVMVEHRHVVRLFEQTQEKFGFTSNDVWTMFHSISFDFSVWEVWGALAYGGTLVIVPPELTRAPEQFHALLREKKVTVLNQTPSAFHQLFTSVTRLANTARFSLRFIIFGGEALDVTMLEPWLARFGDQSPALINMYGITETTVHVTYKRLFEDDLRRREVSPIGTTIPDLQIHLLDKDGKPVPDGMPGEMYVSGAGVARGYLNRLELSEERFIQHGATRMYRSGDLAVRLPTGEFNYLGRSDNQIKVRGFRIEPREVELCLCGHSEVASAIVGPQEYGERDLRLVAYIVLRNGRTPDDPEAAKIVAEVHRHAAENLPLHMRPFSCFVITEIPLTAHGKVDRAALHEWSARQQAFHACASAMSSTEQTVARIWEEILQKKGIGAEDDFFDLGGTSLALIRIFARLNDHFKLSLNGSILAEEATVSRLASCIDEQLNGKKNHLPSKTPTGEIIAHIWEDILQKKNIGPRDDFFDLGGTSLALIRIFSRVNVHFHVSLNGSILAEEATVSRLASCVDAALQHNQAQIQVPGGPNADRSAADPKLCLNT